MKKNLNWRTLMFERTRPYFELFSQNSYRTLNCLFQGIYLCFFLTWRLVIKLDISMVQINQYTTLNDQWRWNSKIKNRNWNLIHRNPYQFRTKLGLTFSAIWDFFDYFSTYFGTFVMFFWVGDFPSRDQTPRLNVDST